MRVLRRLRPERVRVLCVRMYGSLRSNGGPQLSAAKARCSRSLVACASQAAARGKAAPSPDCTQCGILRPHPARPPQASSRTGSRGSACRSPPPHAAERQVSPAGSTGLLPPSANVRKRSGPQTYAFHSFAGSLLSVPLFPPPYGGPTAAEGKTKDAQLKSGASSHCGEDEIRTRGTGCPVRRFSKPVVSATHPPLRDLACEEPPRRKGVQM